MNTIKKYMFVVMLDEYRRGEEVEIEIGDATKEEERKIVEQEYKEWLHGGVIDMFWYEQK